MKGARESDIRQGNVPRVVLILFFFKHESDWPSLSPLVGSCLRRDTPEAAAILGKSLSASASTEELVLTASSVLLVFTAASVHHVDYTIAITQRRFTTCCFTCC